MDDMIRGLAVTLMPAEELSAGGAEDDVMCKCGTNCSVCSGTGSRPCTRIIGDDALDTLKDALAQM